MTDFVQPPPGIHYVPMMVFIDKQGMIRSEKLAGKDSTFFDEGKEVQNIKDELDKLLTGPAAPAAAPKKVVKKQ